MSPCFGLLSRGASQTPVSAEAPSWRAPAPPPASYAVQAPAARANRRRATTAFRASPPRRRPRARPEACLRDEPFFSGTGRPRLRTRGLWQGRGRRAGEPAARPPPLRGHARIQSEAASSMAMEFPQCCARPWGGAKVSARRPRGIYRRSPFDAGARLNLSVEPPAARRRGPPGFWRLARWGRLALARPAPTGRSPKSWFRPEAYPGWSRRPPIGASKRLLERSVNFRHDRQRFSAVAGNGHDPFGDGRPRCRPHGFRRPGTRGMAQRRGRR